MFAESCKKLQFFRKRYS